MPEDLKNSNLDPILRIRTIYPGLRLSEQKVADYINASTNKIIYFSIGTLAREVGVSEASVIRLCKALGYSGFQELKINIAKYYVEPEKFVHSATSEMDETSQMIQKVMKTNQQAIEDTMKMLDPEVIDKCIDIINSSKKLQFYGMAGSAFVAGDAYHKFFKYGIDVDYFSDTHLQAMNAALLDEDCTVVAISATGASLDIAEALNIAKEAGAHTIAITATSNSPVSKIADYTIVAYSKEMEFKMEPMAARIAQLSIIDVLAVGVANKRLNTVVANIDKTRSALKSKKF